MANIQHKDIPDAQLHEPKGILSATAGKIYIATGAGSGTWRKVQEADMDFSDKTKNKFGWNDIADSQYTLASPRAIAATTRTLLTNNGGAAQSDTSRLGTLWDTTNNWFLINDLNAVYNLRIACKVKAAAAAGTPYVLKFELESANGPTVISAADFTIKGGGYENAINYTVPIYMGSFINNQNLKVYVTADTAITMYTTGYVLQRIYKET